MYNKVKVFYSRGQYFGGDDVLKGTVALQNSGKIPFCVVYVFEQSRNSLFASLCSDKDGNYILNGIDLKSGPFFIIAHDPSGEYNGVIADNIGGKNVVD